MSALRAMFSNFLPQYDGGASRRPVGRHASAERRRFERRGIIHPFEDSETRMRLAAGAAGIGVFDLDCETGNMYWSPELRAMAGLPQGNAPLSKEAVVHLVHPDDRELFIASVENLLDPRNHRGLKLDFRLLRADGSVRWVEATGSTCFMGEEEDRHPLMATGIVMDLTAAREAERAPFGGQSHAALPAHDSEVPRETENTLHSAEQYFELAVDGAAIGIWSWDLATGAFACSERCRELLGIAPDEPLNDARFLAALHPDERERGIAAKSEALMKHQAYNIEHRVTLADGSMRWLAFIGRIFCDERSGAAKSMNGIVQDITERKKWEEALMSLNGSLESEIKEKAVALSEATEELARGKWALEQLAHIAARDLQAPLRSVVGFAQLFHKEYRERLNPQADAWLEQLLKSARHISELVQNLQAYAQVDSHGEAFQPVDMRLMFDDTVAAMEAEIRESDARVSCGELPVVMGDRSQLTQMLRQLIGNAITYRGSVPLKIHVSAELEFGKWLFAVRDNGVGIAQQHRERIFNLLSRPHADQEYSGTGIGLALCRRVVNRHGGNIWADSKPGRGSVFYFTLPVGNCERT